MIRTINGREYYYRSERSGGRVVSRYVGSGEAGLLLARLDALRDEGRAAERAGARRAKAEAARLDAAIAGACGLLGRLAGLMMGGLGYHRPGRGRWRRARDMMAMAGGATGPGREVGAIPAAEVPALVGRLRAGDPAARERWAGIVKAARAGDEPASRDMVHVMLADPAEWADAIRSVVEHPRELMLGATFEGGLGGACRGVLRAEVGRLEAELAGADPSPVERLLAARAATCWLDCWLADRDDVQAAGDPARSGPASRRRDRAHNRYLTALKALAAVRRIPVFALQVNVGGGS